MTLNAEAGNAEAGAMEGRSGSTGGSTVPIRFAPHRTSRDGSDSFPRFRPAAEVITSLPLPSQKAPQFRHHLVRPLFLQQVPATEPAAPHVVGQLASGFQHVVELAHRAFGAPQRQWRQDEGAAAVPVGPVMDEVDGGRRAIVLADGVDGGPVAAQVYISAALCVSASAGATAG